MEFAIGDFFDVISPIPGEASIRYHVVKPFNLNTESIRAGVDLNATAVTTQEKVKNSNKIMDHLLVNEFVNIRPDKVTIN